MQIRIIMKYVLPIRLTGIFKNDNPQGLAPQPSGLVCALHFGSPGLVPGHGPTPLVCQWPCCHSSSHTKRGRLAADVSSG